MLEDQSASLRRLSGQQNPLYPGDSVPHSSHYPGYPEASKQRQGVQFNLWVLETQRSMFYFSSSTETMSQLFFKLLLEFVKIQHSLKYTTHIRYVKLEVSQSEHLHGTSTQIKIEDPASPPAGFQGLSPGTTLKSDHCSNFKHYRSFDLELKSQFLYM